MLDTSQRDLLLRLSPGAFDDNRALWAQALATEHWLRDRDNSSLHAALGYILALLGLGEQAVREGERAVELARIKRDAYFGGNALTYLAFIHTRLGNPEPAIDVLERLLKAPYFVTPGWLRVDPNFDALRGNPRFEKL